MKNKKEMKEMEFPDAPSGYVKLYRYKEPFMEFKGGFGYEGVLLFDGSTDKVQCHFCGEWFDYLPRHVRKDHGMRADEYHRETGLAPRTALLSESARAALLRNIDVRKRNLIVGRGAKTAATKNKIAEGVRRYGATRENQNANGSCPQQLKTWLRNMASELGRTPTRAEVDSRMFAIRRRFGSYAKLCEAAGLKPRKNGVTLGRRAPNYTDEELLEYILNFNEAFGRRPHHSDCARGLLPNYMVFCRHFGTFRNAVEEAGLKYD